MYTRKSEKDLLVIKYTKWNQGSETISTEINSKTDFECIILLREIGNVLDQFEDTVMTNIMYPKKNLEKQ